MKTRARLVGLLATLLLLGVLVGLPATLLALGANPVPTSLPSIDQLRAALTTPDDGTLALAAVKGVAWVAWLVLAASILFEVAARIRGVRTLALPGLGMAQIAARHLVGAAALLFVVVPTTATPASAAPGHGPATPAHVAAPVRVARAAPPSPSPPTAAGARMYTVQAGDTLSGIAARHLRDPGRWHELAELNPNVAAHPDRIYPGTQLRLPAAPEHTYIVQAGDTLSGIAERELGDAAEYLQIFEASRGTVQPGGTPLGDPDQIDVGQTLTIPGQSSAGATPSSGPVAESSAPRHLAPTLRTANAEDPMPTPAIPATSASPAPSEAAQKASQTSAAPAALDQPADAPWIVAGLTGAGALLAGAMLIMLRRRRRAQFRHRRPGRTLASRAPALSPVERTITAVGALAAPTVEHMDTVLRRLAAAAVRDGHALPDLAAVELTATDLVLHLAGPARLPHPWRGSDDGYHWNLPGGTTTDKVGPDIADQPAPYPLLVTVGLGDNGEVWLLNIEDLDLSITGDPVFGQDFARYLAAEVACNPWSAGVDVACLGVAAELAALNPDRIHAYDPTDRSTDPIGAFLADAIATIDRAGDAGVDVPTARSGQAGADPWPARLLLVDAATQNPALDHLLEVVYTHAGGTGTCVVVRGHRPQTPGTVLEVTADGRVALPEAGLDLVAVGLTSDEAQGCAALLAHADTLTDAPVPVDAGATGGWRCFADEAGALRPEHTLPRVEQGEPDAEPSTSSLLDEADDTYVQVAATTTADLRTLAPRVAQRVRADVEDADPTLDDDLAMWFRDDSALPKLRLLGPVRATTRGKPLVKRKPYMTELLAFIALRPHGATPEEVAETFNITQPKARDYVLGIRQWLGTNPRTGDPHLPDARLAPAAAIRGIPVYQVLDLLIDIDLFRRLRVRGQARGGPAGIKDLQTALRLVQGRPFDYPLQREAAGGWGFLLAGDRLDEHMAVAIVDVAHLVTTHALAQADLATARLAAETAALAAPHEEIPRLDLAAVAAAEGHHAEAQRIIRDQVCNRTDDEGAPPELPARTEQVLRGRKDWVGSKAS